MIRELLAIYDLKSRVYHPPFTSINNADGIRSFDRLVKGESFMRGYEEDYVLHNIGNFDDETGKIQNTGEPIHLVKASDLVLERSGHGSSAQKT